MDWIVPEWDAPGSVRALSTQRGGGVSSAPYGSLNLGTHVGDALDAVDQNRRRLRTAAALPAEPRWLAQVHGIEVADLDRLPAGSQPPAADAAITRRGGQVCAILTADCLPVLLATDAGDAVAAAHAGWRGLAAGVLEATVRALGAPPSRLIAWLGPAIGPRHFEVGSEVREAFIQRDPGAQALFSANPRGRYQADLAGLARRCLERLGVERIGGARECTFERSERYFSHRRDGRTGRQATLIWLEKPDD